MIKSFNFQNFGPLAQANADALSQINLFVGANSTGKTFLLKALYSIIRAQEQTGRGDEPREFAELLSEKLYWTFQAEKLGDLVQKGGGKRLRASLTMDDRGTLAFEFGQDTTRKITLDCNSLPQREANSVFCPLKRFCL